MVKLVLLVPSIILAQIWCYLLDMVKLVLLVPSIILAQICEIIYVVYTQIWL